MRRIPILLTTSAFAIIALVVFQLQWIQHSRDLSEELFEDKVCMALCTTVEQQSNDGCCRLVDILTEEDSSEVATLPITCEKMAKDSNFQQTLEEVLGFYQIDLTYDLSFSAQEMEKGKGNGTYSCSMAPYISEEEELFVNLSFPDKKTYISQKMGWMLLASILIILFITAVFLYANWSLWQQKRQAEINTDFFNNMAHESRTPLTNIGLAAKMLQKKYPELKKDKYLNIIRGENQKMVGQVERVLHLSRVENGEYHLQKESLNLRQLLEEVTDDLHIQMSACQAKINLQNIDNQLIVFGDKVHLGNVFKNLFDNALKYSEKPPSIQVTAQPNGKNLLVQVQDNGIGISKKEQIHIFEKYQRVPTGNVQNRRGFGLGLAYVKMMMNLHGGSVKVNSEVNRGTRFDLQFPLS